MVNVKETEDMSLTPFFKTENDCNDISIYSDFELDGEPSVDYEEDEFPSLGRIHSEGSNDESQDTSLSTSSSERSYKMNHVKRSNSQITVCKVNVSSEKGCRVYDKKQSCYFCGKLIGKITRHWFQAHSKEKVIRDIEKLPKKSEERLKYIEHLRIQGNFRHNIKVLRDKKGELLVARRSKHSQSPDQYLPCEHCFNFYHKQDLKNHFKGCKFKKWSSNHESALSAGRRLILSHTVKFRSEELEKNVLCRMQKDKIYDIVLEDKLILQFGSILTKKYGNESASKWQHVSHRMRQLGRLVDKFKQKFVVNNLSDVFHPNQFDNLVQVTKDLCQEDKKNISLGTKLGHSLVECCKILISFCLKNDIRESAIHAEDFLDIFDSEWSDLINSPIFHELKSIRLNKNNVLSLTLDLMKFGKYMDENIENYKIMLLENPSLDNWNYLAKLTLTKLILYNKKRGGETARLLRVDYNDLPSWECQNNEVLKSLTKFERRISSDNRILKMKGKRGRQLPLLFSNQLKNAMHVLEVTREQCGVPDSRYFFQDREKGYIRPWACMRHFMLISNLNHPELITSTNMRSYIAALCQILSLNIDELDWLAAHLCHDVSVHKEFYTLHQSELNLAKVSKLLLLAESEELIKFAGKTISELSAEELWDDGSEINEYNKVDVYNLDYGNSSGDSRIHNYNNNNNNDTYGESLICEVDVIFETGDSNDNGEMNMKSNLKDSMSVTRVKKRKKRSDKIWRVNDKDEIRKYFCDFIKSKKNPKKKEVLEFLSKHPIPDRNYREIIFFIKNEYSKFH